MRIKLDLKLIQTISLFERITRARVKDCIDQSNSFVFIVYPGEMAKAIGPQGKNVKKLEQMLKKKIRIMEYNDELLTFVKNVISPLKAEGIIEEEGIVTITPTDSRSRGLLIGREAVHLRAFEAIVKRYFDISEMKVV